MKTVRSSGVNPCACCSLTSKTRGLNASGAWNCAWLSTVKLCKLESLSSVVFKYSGDASEDIFCENIKFGLLPCNDFSKSQENAAFPEEASSLSNVNANLKRGEYLTTRCASLFDCMVYGARSPTIISTRRSVDNEAGTRDNQIEMKPRYSTS